MQAHLLERFAALFQGKRYLHRNAGLGDFVSEALPEDLYQLRLSPTLSKRIECRVRVLNLKNQRHGIKSRRGDGAFGLLIPGATVEQRPNTHVALGPIATIEIGTEVKILQKAMIKQIDRVMGDLTKQVAHFRKGGDNPITVAIVGINQADHCVSYEGDRSYPTDGKGHKHPFQEAKEAERRVQTEVAPAYDELLFLRYRATNCEPYDFAWADEQKTRLEYGALLARVAQRYDRQYGSGP